MTVMKLQVAFKFENLIMSIGGLHIVNSQNTNREGIANIYINSSNVRDRLFSISLECIDMLQIYCFETKQNATNYQLAT